MSASNGDICAACGIYFSPKLTVVVVFSGSTATNKKTNMQLNMRGCKLMLQSGMPIAQMLSSSGKKMVSNGMANRTPLASGHPLPGRLVLISMPPHAAKLQLWTHTSGSLRLCNTESTPAPVACNALLTMAHPLAANTASQVKILSAAIASSIQMVINQFWPVSLTWTLQEKQILLNRLPSCTG